MQIAYAYETVWLSARKSLQRECSGLLNTIIKEQRFLKADCDGTIIEAILQLSGESEVGNERKMRVKRGILPLLE